MEGGIQINVPLEGEVSGAIGYVVYALIGETWQEVLQFPANTKRKASAITWWVDNPLDIHWYMLKIASVNPWGQAGTPSDQKPMSNRLLLSGDWTPGAPVIVEGGGYPLISRVAVGPHQAFSITLKVQAVTSEADSIDHYEVRRRDNESGDWSQYEKLPIYKVLNSPAPVIIFYDNTDRKLKPTCSYRYQVRAVALNGVAGAWSNEVTVLLTEDSTGPDQPTFNIYNLVGSNVIEISAPTQNGGNPCPDFSHFKIEGYEQTAGTWVTLEPQWRSTVYIHMIDDVDLGENWKYRITAYDHSKNPSPVSAESAYKQQKKAGTAYLSSAVNATLNQVTTNEGDISSHSTLISQNATEIALRATTVYVDGSTIKGAIEVNAGNINLRVEKDDVIGQINVSAEEITIDGNRFHVTGDTIFDADVEIQGILKSTGGIKTSLGDDRIEIGAFGGVERIRFYKGGALVLTMHSDANGLYIDGPLKIDGTYLDCDSISINESWLVDSNKNACFAAVRLTTGAGANKVLQSDADGDAS
ncbi:hypothetical protein ES703_97459 [subsurface metagenome]